MHLRRWGWVTSCNISCQPYLPRNPLVVFTDISFGGIGRGLLLFFRMKGLLLVTFRAKLTYPAVPLLSSLTFLLEALGVGYFFRIFSDPNACLVSAGRVPTHPPRNPPFGLGALHQHVLEALGMGYFFRNLDFLPTPQSSICNAARKQAGSRAMASENWYSEV